MPMRNLTDLDFQPRRPGPLPVLLLLVGAVLCADQWIEYNRLREQREETQGRLEQVERRAARIDASRRDSQPENVFSADENKALRQTFGAIRVDWAALNRHIENATSADVALLAVRPNVSGRALQISGEARNISAALAFVDALRTHPLADVVLVSHQIRQNDPQRPIVFEISATWTTGS